MQTQPQTNERRCVLSERIVAHRDTNSRLERIEFALAKHPSHNGRTWRNRFLISMGALVMVSAVAVAAITTATTSFSATRSDVYNHDETKFTLVSQGLDVAGSAASAAGSAQGSPVEMATTFGAATTALSAGDWFYKIDAKEADIATVTSGPYKVELFVDGMSKGSLYVAQGTADATAVEGVTLKWSLGASLTGNASYVIKVSAV